MERVGTVLRDLGRGDTLLRRLAQARALEKWPEIVGPLLSGRTRALRVADGRLVVLAPGAALRQELTFHKRTILRKFNEAIGRTEARDVVFLESDSLAWEGTVPATRPAVRRAEPEAPVVPGADAGAEEEEEKIVDAPAVVPSFDAEEYRRRMNGIAGEVGPTPREKR
ncbi:MAG TPA: DUF721 domain-containing protein [bacterium]|nr:DUF721 domain-containing protein [bacterium]